MTRAHPMRHSPRRGSALILVLIMTLALAGLATSAIYMATNSGLLSRYHDKERDVTLAVETALELGRSRLQRDTSLILYDTGYVQLLTNQAVTTASGATIPGLTVNLYAGYTGDTTGANVPYITLLATVNEAGSLRAARRMDLVSQSFWRYGLFANDFPAAASIGAGENVGGRVHTNNRFIASLSGSPDPAFSDTVSTAGAISGSGQFADSLSSAANVNVLPYPSGTTAYWGATSLRQYFLSYASNASLNISVQSPTGYARGTSGGVDISGGSGFTVYAGTRIEFLTIDVNNNGQADSTEGFFKVFHIYPGQYSNCCSYYSVGGLDTARITTNFSGTPVSTSNITMLNQCGAFYTIGGRREFFPMSMHRVAWVQTRIQTSTYPTVSAAQAATMSAMDRTAIRTIAQQPTARCFPIGSPYLMNVERFTISTGCVQDWNTVPATRYTFGSSPGCTATQKYGGQDTTFTQYIFTCPVDFGDTAGRCYGETAYIGWWDQFSGSSSLPSPLPAAVRQNYERYFLYPISRVYNSSSRGVIYTTGRVFVSGTIRGSATLYVNGTATLIDDLTYDRDPADSTNLCRNQFGLIARDSIIVSDNALNRPRVYDTPSSTAGYTLSLGGNREFLFHGVGMALNGTFNTYNPGVATATNPVYTCPLGSSFTAAGGCLHVTGGVVEKTYTAPYTSTTNSGLRPLRELDPCQNTTRRAPYFPIVRTRVRPLRTFDVDVRQLRSTSQLTSYFNRLRSGKPAP